ncbi:MAG: hypothetical protein JW735_12115 [Prolixibacteraceae bacterium]|nr:hypothetical protein [Prolixibacteraceae bacterium]
MKTIISILMITLTAFTVSAQQSVSVNASNYDISDNLDLKAVAYLFGESKNLEFFERKLNDPELNISNLDLNFDGYIDYLRVVEVGKNNYYVVTIQAVLGENIYQDVATIDVEVRNRRTLKVQVVGNQYLYGRNYVIQPVYAFRPVIIDFYVRPRRYVWASPWYWGYYPSYYYYRQPRSVHVYHHHIYDFYGPRFKCHYVHYRPHHKSAYYHQKVHRNDWAKKHPDKSFEYRNNGVSNRYELNNRRSASLNQQFPGSNSKSGSSSKSLQSNNSSNRREAVRLNQPVYKAPAEKSEQKSSSVTKYNQSNTSRRYTYDANVSERSNNDAVNKNQRNSRSTQNGYRNEKTNSPAKSATVNKQTEPRRKAEVSRSAERTKHPEAKVQQKSSQSKPESRRSSTSGRSPNSSRSENSSRGARR